MARPIPRQLRKPSLSRSTEGALCDIATVLEEELPNLRLLSSSVNDLAITLGDLTDRYFKETL